MQCTWQKISSTYTFCPFPTVSPRIHKNLGANPTVLKHKKLYAVSRNKKLVSNGQFFNNSVFFFAGFPPSLVFTQLMYFQIVMLESMMLIILGAYQLDAVETPTVEACSLSSLISLNFNYCWAPHSTAHNIYYNHTHVFNKHSINPINAAAVASSEPPVLPEHDFNLHCFNPNFNFSQPSNCSHQCFKLHKYPKTVVLLVQQIHQNS